MAAAARGRPTGSTEKPWRDAIRLAVNATTGDGDPKKLRLIAEKLVELALAGDAAAIKEIGDRLDGKPAQAVVGEGEGGAIEISHIVRTIIDPRNPDA
jgi:hypothetical protein